MKKLGLILVTGALTLGLVACGGTDDKTKTPDVSEETVEATTASDVEEFTITATNWDFSSDKELIIKKGTNVKFNLINEEGFHTISNDELGIDLSVDAPSEFTAETTGEFELICSTMCGGKDDHEAMKISIKIID